MAERPLNQCLACNTTWFPRGSDLSRRCPSCKREDSIVIPSRMATPASRKPSNASAGLSIGCLLAILLALPLACVVPFAAMLATRDKEIRPTHVSRAKEPKGHESKPARTVPVATRVNPPQPSPSPVEVLPHPEVEFPFYSHADAWRAGEKLLGHRIRVGGTARVSATKANVYVRYVEAGRNHVVCVVPVERAGPLASGLAGTESRDVVIEGVVVKVDGGVSMDDGRVLEVGVSNTKP